MEQLKLAFQFKHKMLPTDLFTLFELNSVVKSSHSTRNVCNEGLFIPRIFTTSFGITSLRYAAPLLWNKFLKCHLEINTFNKLVTFNRYLQKF